MTEPNRIDVYLEVGRSRVFACAVEWPGWCRSGKDEGAALAVLRDSGPRYAAVLGRQGLAVPAPSALDAFEVIERLTGTATTDFGALDKTPAADLAPVGPAELSRLTSILQAAWMALDASAESASGKELLKGPRGGGRDVESIIRHVLRGNHLSSLGSRFRLRPGAGLLEARESIRAAVLEGLRAAVAGEVPAIGPRGGRRWTPRYFVRRAAWHALDHAWEIEDRLP